MNTTKPSVGAVRAADELLRHKPLTVLAMAQIIDHESGLAELLEAAKLLLADLLHDPHSRGYDSVAIAESAIARAENPATSAPAFCPHCSRELPSAESRCYCKNFA